MPAIYPPTSPSKSSHLPCASSVARLCCIASKTVLAHHLHDKILFMCSVCLCLLCPDVLPVCLDRVRVINFDWHCMVKELREKGTFEGLWALLESIISQVTASCIP